MERLDRTVLLKLCSLHAHKSQHPELPSAGVRVSFVCQHRTSLTCTPHERIQIDEMLDRLWHTDAETRRAVLSMESVQHVSDSLPNTCSVRQDVCSHEVRGIRMRCIYGKT